MVSYYGQNMFHWYHRADFVRFSNLKGSFPRFFPLLGFSKTQSYCSETTLERHSMFSSGHSRAMLYQVQQRSPVILFFFANIRLLNPIFLLWDSSETALKARHLGSWIQQPYFSEWNFFCFTNNATGCRNFCLL